MRTVPYVTAESLLWHIALLLPLPAPVRRTWTLLDRTSPSGKRLFRCTGCGCETPRPMPECRADAGYRVTCVQAEERR